ncbi:MAG: pseudouridine synthase [Candidatus Izemoplasmatales bacterium]|jgi:23S rRNA pseudouridine2605 synthase|nr:pseudouridine synthase [Candidatus Izemoplasmatales bacterium]NLF48141.1 rRNA pseudouridine synthase [Acholeplasmataceae bacterium]MDD4354357.1 pseudouridine synthase [Candidatus Izemoplasmatales bacterium]MDD4987694.1 pseudouridine synthase [Candidatus Izemoplasmatales bacterium]MDD5602390.1 pseudouridine synthase [Candidatus Izemoplasmatales bacterium]
MERLQKILQRAGIASRRKAEEMIASGKVKVNGIEIRDMGVKVDPAAEIICDGVRISYEEKVYWVLNKPEGVVSTTKDEHGRKTVMDLLNVSERIFPVGRLDYNTSGIILFTNDGTFSNQLTHPRFKLEKEYHVKVAGLLRKEESVTVEKGILIDGVRTKPAIINKVRYDDKKENTYVNIVITEGKYHQVKKMFEAIGHPVLMLKRYRFGSVTTDGLKPGDARLLKPHEIKQLWNLSQHGK